MRDNELSGEFPAEMGNLSDLEEITLWGNDFTWADSYANGRLADLVSLVALYEATSPEVNWEERSDFPHFGTNENLAWHRVQGLSSDGRVQNLQLHGTNMTGSLPPEIGLLTGLEHLSASNNRGLVGTIPSEIGNLTNLRELLLHENALTGEIPPQLGNLVKLKKLDLRSNQLSGPVPTDLGNLVSLQQLHLRDNNLSGELPTELGNLLGLQAISLWGNDFTWADSYANGRLADLVALVAIYEATSPRVNWEELSGFPSTSWTGVDRISSDGRIDALYFVNEQNHTGSLPPEIGLLAGLEILELSDNRGLTGTIPPEVGNLTNLEILKLVGNALTGEVPPQVGNLVKLNQLDLSNNKLSGEVPPQVGNLVKLNQLDLSNNKLSGEVPSDLGNLLNLQRLFLRDNDLSGEFPSELGNLLALEFISLWGNDFTWADSYANGRLADLVALMALYEATSPQVNWQERF